MIKSTSRSMPRRWVRKEVTSGKMRMAAMPIQIRIQKRKPSVGIRGSRYEWITFAKVARIKASRRNWAGLIALTSVLWSG